MPLFQTVDPSVPLAVCATIDWSQLKPAEKAFARREVQARIAGGDRPDKLVPLSCVRGKFTMGRFVDEKGNLYRLADIALVLGEVPETRADLKAYRRARAMEIGSVSAAIALSPGVALGPWGGTVSMIGALAATNSNGAARSALARAVTAYNATTFWADTEETYAQVSGIPTAVARETELLYAARSCFIERTDPKFIADATVVWDYANHGYDAGALMQAAEVAPAALGCDLAQALPVGVATRPEPATVFVEE